MPTYQRVAQGIALVPEGRRLFAAMTVEENLQIAHASGRPGEWTVDRVMDTFPMLKARRKAYCGTLSGGEQQATAIGRALMTNPRCCCSMRSRLGLSPLAVDWSTNPLNLLIATGATILLVEQDLKRALKVANRVICMLEGRIVVEGDAKTLTREQITRRVFRAPEAGSKAGRRHELCQRRHRRRIAWWVLRHDRLRALVHVRGDEDYQSCARKPRIVAALRALVHRRQTGI